MTLKNLAKSSKHQECSEFAFLSALRNCKFLMNRFEGTKNKGYSKLSIDDFHWIFDGKNYDSLIKQFGD